jgi:heme/copper-type cytochrome/quinol oxidase subunit 2
VLLSNAIRPLATLALLLQAQPTCDAASDSFKCHLASILHLLTIAAAVLGVVLVIVLIVVIRYYQTNRKADEDKKNR